jgi:ABC-type nickel/cobalt efflux system permease component RcnA
MPGSRFGGKRNRLLAPAEGVGDHDHDRDRDHDHDHDRDRDHDRDHDHDHDHDRDSAGLRGPRDRPSLHFARASRAGTTGARCRGCGS